MTACERMLVPGNLLAPHYVCRFCRTGKGGLVGWAGHATQVDAPGANPND